MALFEWVELISVVIAASSSIAAITPTPKDDELVGKVQKAYGKAYKVLDLLALNVLKAKDR
jgi:hypothetical protein